MGGHHHAHSYALQTLAFYITLLPSLGVLALLTGALVEKRQRSHGSRAVKAIAAWRSDVPSPAFAFRK